MNPIPSLATAFAAPLIACTPTSPDRSGALLHAGERGEVVHACAAMEAAFGGSDAQGLWGGNEAYEACEIGQMFGTAMRARVGGSAFSKAAA